MLNELLHFSLLASSLTDSFGSSGGGNTAINSRTLRQTSVPVPPANNYLNGTDGTNLEVLEYPFLTMKTYPPGFIIHIGMPLLVLMDLAN